MRTLESIRRAAARHVAAGKGAMASVALWVTGTWFFGMAYTMTGVRADRHDEVVAFVLGFATASAIATVTALAVAGRRRWALVASAGLSAFAFVVAVVIVGLAFLAVPPARAFGPPASEDVFLIARQYLDSVERVAMVATMAGLFMGCAIGLIAGLWILLVGRWPRLVGWLSAALLVAVVARTSHIAAFNRVALDATTSRIASGPGIFHPAHRLELPSAMGAMAGAIGGATATGAVLWWAGRRRAAGRLAFERKPPSRVFEGPPGRIGPDASHMSRELAQGRGPADAATLRGECR